MISEANAFSDALLGKPQFIHWSNTPGGVCARKDSKADVWTDTHGETTIEHSAVASHFGNVTCPRCKRWYKSRK